MSRAQAVAERLLERYGVPLTITATDAGTGDVVLRTAHGAVIGSVRHVLAGQVGIEIGDEVLFVTSSAAPEVGARIDYIDRRRVVASVEPIFDRSTVATWRVYAREG